MKYLLLLCDGMADVPLEELGNKTPLEVASKPNMDSIAAKSRMGLLETFTEGMPTGSTIANLSVLGYDPAECFEGRKTEGRGFFEAASLGLSPSKDDVAFRCNLINIKDGKINSHSAGNISSEEAKQLILFLNEKLGNSKVKFFPGLSYRHVVIVKNASLDIECAQPHDHANEEFQKLLVKPLKKEAKQTAELLNKLILDSIELLANHPVNLQRQKEGKLPANSIWLWSGSKKPKIVEFKKNLACPAQ